jgi:hypothetical protein
MSPNRSQTSFVSVIIPAFNSARVLIRSIESVLCQTYSQYELIVIDDGSTDNTAEVIRQFSCEIVYRRQENLGPSAARNHGVRLAKGDSIAFLDADDFWMPDFLCSCADFLNRYPETSAVSTGQKILLAGGEEIINPVILENGIADQTEMVLSDFYQFWAEHDHVRTGSCMIRKEVMDRAGLMREDLRAAEDLEYWGYLATFGNWGFIPRVLWAGDLAACAAGEGRFAKNRKRWHACPTVEDWQKRVLPRLRGTDWVGFRIVRGRVAQTFAYAKLLAGSFREARHVVQHYGQDFPANSVAQLLNWLGPKHLTFWKAAYFILILREMGKDLTMKAPVLCSRDRIPLPKGGAGA